MSKFTRGPVTVKGHAIYDGINESPIVEVHRPFFRSGGEPQSIHDVRQGANTELIAAAFNAATEAEAMGFDGVAALRALPELLKALQGCTGFLDDMADDYAEYGVTDKAYRVKHALALAAARGKEEE